MKLLRAVIPTVLFSLTTWPALAQAPPPPPPTLPSPQLDQLVARIALYPDPLLAQVLAAATYPEQIPDAARWADQHHYLTGQALAAAIQGDQVPWDPSVQALLPFPSVLDMMASDMGWTQQLGNAFLVQQQDVMDAVQRQRALASRYGYLRTNPQIVVSGGPYITIMPVNPAFIVVPAYDPAIVFFAPRPGFVVGGAIHFGFGITIGTFFRPWGWGVGLSLFDWGRHTVVINNAPWGRTWANHVAYVHPYPAVRRVAPAARSGGVAPRPVEQHQLRERSPAERESARRGERPREEHERR
jgi:hypothetical protein